MAIKRDFLRNAQNKKLIIFLSTMFQTKRRGDTVFWNGICANSSNSCRITSEITINHYYTRHRRPDNTNCLYSTQKAYTFLKTQNMTCQEKTAFIRLHQAVRSNSKNVTLDKQMISITDMCAVKQYVSGKSNPEGLNNFVLAAKSDLALHF